MPAFLVDATPGTGPAPENAVPVTLWGAGSGGGGGPVDAADIPVDIAVGPFAGAADNLEDALNLISQVFGNVSATQSDHEARIAALEA